MKKIILLIMVFLSVYAFGKNNDNIIEQEIVDKIVYALYPKKEIIFIYYYGDKLPQSLKTNPDIKITDKIDKADIIILGDDGWKSKKRVNKPIIVLKYLLLEKYPSAIGAYFWQKSRPNIVMIKPRLEKMHIKLPNEFERYTESRVW